MDGTFTSGYTHTGWNHEIHTEEDVQVRPDIPTPGIHMVHHLRAKCNLDSGTSGEMCGDTSDTFDSQPVVEIQLQS
jgi:hypothetical protein